MKIVLNVLKWIGIIFLAIIVLIVLLLFWLSKQPFVPTKYTSSVETGGAIEAKYIAMGNYEVKCFETDAPEDWGKFIIHYPTELESSNNTYPVVVFANGTGVYASKYPALFKHLASWGFIVIGNEDPSTCTGDSADATLAYLLEQNENRDSVFHQKVNTEKIGISGHSQGGVAVFNAVTEQPHGTLYTCAVSLSPTDLEVADAIGLHYEPDKMKIPTLLLAATENDVIMPDGVQRVYDMIDAEKVAALRENAAHGEMLYYADGYVTAWFMWQLKGDEDAAKAFAGDNPEIMSNSLYQDQQNNIGD